MILCCPSLTETSLCGAWLQTELKLVELYAYGQTDREILVNTRRECARHEKNEFIEFGSKYSEAANLILHCAV